MESRLQDHERIRGGLYFIKDIPRDENWKVRRDILAAYQPRTADQCELGESAGPPPEQAQLAEAQPAEAQTEPKKPDEALSKERVPSSSAGTAKVTPKIETKKVVQELERQADGSYVTPPYEAETSSPRTKRANRPVKDALGQVRKVIPTKR